MCVDAVPQGLALLEGKFLDFGAELCHGIVVFLDGERDVGADVVDAAAETVVVELLYFGIFIFDFLKDGGDGLEVAGRFVAEDLLQE